MTEFIQYIIINNELKMSCGKKCAQASHASISVIEKVNQKIMNEWKQQGMKKIVLKIDSTEKLIKKFQEIKDAKLPVALITDAGKTQIPSGSKTAFACGPIKEETAKIYFKNLKLL